MMTVQLNYNEYGVGLSSQPLIILHGVFGDNDNWRSIAKRLATEYHVITVDLRNHGQSEHALEMNYVLMANDVLELLNRLGHSLFKVMGHSMGGKVAMIMALSEPKQVTHLIVVDIAPKTYPLHHLPLLKALLCIPIATLKSRKEADIALAPTVSDPLTRGFLLKNLKKTTQGQGYQWTCYLEAIHQNYSTLASFPSMHKAVDIKSDFIRGQLSDYIQACDSAIIQTFFPVMQLHTIKEAGHMPHIEQGELFFSRLKKVLKS